MAKEDNEVHDCQKVYGWKACAKPMEIVPQKFKYKQKEDNRGSTIEGVYIYRYMYGRVGVFKPWTLDKRIHDRPRFRIRPRFQNVYKTY